MKKLLVAAAFAVAAFFPAGALAATFSGVVVGNGGGSLAVAAKGGLVRTVHSRANVRLGARVHVSGRTVRPFGFASRARIHGVVVRRAAGTTFLAAGRSLLAMRGATAAPSGAVVNAGVAIGGGQLTQQSLQIVGHDDRVTVQAPVTAVGPRNDHRHHQRPAADLATAGGHPVAGLARRSDRDAHRRDRGRERGRGGSRGRG
jgi:hypothetical protein